MSHPTDTVQRLHYIDLSLSQNASSLPHTQPDVVHKYGVDAEQEEVV